MFSSGWIKWIASVIVLCFAFALPAIAAEGARPGVSFNHDQTLFPLSGIHTNIACESCHVKGVFKGTPTTCIDCHSRGGAVIAQMKPTTHIPTTQDCATCHKTLGWIPAIFSHEGLTQSCSTCHNGTNQTGKPATHIQTVKECGECHKTTAWVPAGIDHSTLAPPPDGRCADCHGRTATGKPARHVVTTAQCDVCHKTLPVGFSWLPASFSHNPGDIDCKSCHNGSTATGMTVKHIQTTAQCSDCHTQAGWTPTSFAHTPAQVGTKVCSDCHNGTSAKGVTPKHIPVSGIGCDSCHTTAGWIPTSFAHSSAQVSGKKCSDCHNGTNATGKNTGHISTASYPLCDTCHTTTAWKPTQFAHINVTIGSDCTTCHDGTHATARPSTGAKAHKVAPMLAKTCGSCHSVGTAWSPATMNHSGATSCTSCHTIGSAGNTWTPGKINHISTTGHTQCADCHTTAVWKPSTFNHQGIASTSNCTVSCHNGTNAAGRPTSGAKAHIASPMTSVTCGSCHLMGTSWIPATMNHTNATTCTACHAYFGNTWSPAKLNHLVTALQCSTCHTSTAWLPSTFKHQGVTSAATCTQSGCHDASNAPTPRAGQPLGGAKAHSTAPMNSGKCADCHTIGTAWTPANMNHTGAVLCSNCHIKTGNLWTPTPLSHIGTSSQCSTCHATNVWKPASSFDHAAAVPAITSASDCTGSGCHNGTSATGRPTTGAKAHTIAPMNGNTCGSCHAIGSVWSPATMDHSSATSCISCHAISAAGNSWTPGKTNHISTTGHAQCADCHMTTAWKPTNFAHGSGITSASDCYTGCHNGTAATGRPTTGSKAHASAPLNAKTCGSCHTIGTAWVPATMNHGGVTTCTSCHAISAAGNAWTPGKTNHIATTGYPQCLSCHTVTAWLPTSFAHSGVTGASNCTTCHNGTSATGRPATGAKAHSLAPLTSNTCGSCHTIGTAWTPATMNHAGLTTCTACHTYTGNGFTTPIRVNHIVTTAQCSSCHTTTAWAPASFSHQGVTAATDCTQSGCHYTALKVAPQAGRPATHSTVPMTGNTCASCHSIGVSWTPWTMNHGGATACSTCHSKTGNNWTPTPAAHISTVAQCSICHITNAWVPASKFDHSAASVTTATDCTQSGCHGTAGKAVPAAGRPISGAKAHTLAPMTHNTCGNCHGVGTTWAPATMDHTGLSNCSTCHATAGNGFTPAKTNHISTAGYPQCSSCHITTAWLPTSFAHSGVNPADDCSTCHNGAGATGRPTAGAKAHTVSPMTKTTCGSCHNIGTAWIPATMDHTGATGCANCHSYTGNGFTPAKATHISTSLQCSNCHLTSLWLPATFDHAANGVTSATNCTQSGCHDTANRAAPRAGKPSTGTKAHTTAPMTNNTCADCHSGYSSWTTVTMSHTGATSCSSCHTKTAGVWTPVTKNTGAGWVHITTSSQCSVCHTTTKFFPASGSHNGVTSATNCTQSGCHVGSSTSSPMGRPANHTTAPMLSTTCGSCHSVGTVWAPWSMNHTGATACATCHVTAGNGWTPAKANHIATTGYPQCSSCHTSTAWLPTSFKHTGVTAASNCTTCHNGTSATGRPASGTKAHTAAPMTNNTCGSCHTIGTAWVPATMNHTGATSCTSCHGAMASAGVANNFTPAKANHINVAGYSQCSSCHTTTAWLPTSFNHSGITAATDCTTGCHNTTNATGRPISGTKAHSQPPLSTGNCGSCHLIGSAWVPATMNHTGLTSCTGCHATAGNGFTPAKANHIPIAAQQCSVCHTTTGWLPTSYNHQGVVAGTCATCHNGTLAVGKPGSHPAGIPAACDACHRTTGWSPATYAHTGVTNNCTLCHGGGFATSKSAAHFITTQPCEKCHTTTAWTPIKSYVHTSIYYKTHTGLSMTLYADCKLCHINNNEVITGAPHRGNAAYKPDCAWCHATQYKSGSHKKTQSPTTVFYTVAELKDCAGACHEYTNNTFTTIKTSRTGKHRATSSGF